MAKQLKPEIVWFRRDLRVADQAALAAAARSGGPVICVFILDDGNAGQWKAGGAGRWWLHHSLLSLDASLRTLGTSLLLRRGDSADTILALAQEVGAGAIHTGIMPEPWERAADAAVADGLRAADCRFHRHATSLLHDPDAVTTLAGKPFSVFTPFANAFMRDVHVGLPEPAPTILESKTRPPSETLSDWRLLPTMSWEAGIAAAWTPGEAGAAATLHRFLGDGLDGYDIGRNAVAETGTSALSPFLHWGEMSPTQVWAATHEADHPRSAGAVAYRRELVWREFAAHILWHHPTLPTAPLRPEFQAFPWRRDPAALTAWQRGQTGVPIVDAAMRQLWSTGWMHNRARMITASYLVKHLLVPWQDGEAWFWDTLVDGDLANNSVNWQWVAGSGADAAPFFRIFNPVLQGRKFDTAGDYVRRWVPELARLDTRYLHEPWAAPASALAGAGVVLGKTYPAPLVDLAFGRARALTALRDTTGASADRLV